MPTKNAPFYSCKAGRPETVKSHRTRKAAMAAAGEMGQIWITETQTQRQVHKVADGSWGTFKPDDFLAANLKATLVDSGLIEVKKQ